MITFHQIQEMIRHVDWSVPFVILIIIVNIIILIVSSISAYFHKCRGYVAIFLGNSILASQIINDILSENHDFFGLPMKIFEDNTFIFIFWGLPSFVSLVILSISFSLQAFQIIFDISKSSKSNEENDDI